MYGGLFGDLPPTKAQKKSNNDEDKSNSKSDPITYKQSAADPKEDDAKQAKAAKVKQEPSVISKLGVSGTAMAFIPMAARRKKRPLPINTSPSKKASVPKVAEEAPVKTEHRSEDVPAKGENSSFHQQKAPVKEGRSTVPGETNAQSLTIVETIPVEQGVEEEVIPVKEDEKAELPSENETKRTPEAPTTFRPNSHKVDRYDPLLPNDLLEHWERQNVEKKLQEQQRQQQELAQKLATSTRERPSVRGRGRGLSNLPAWMTEKKKRDLGKE